MRSAFSSRLPIPRSDLARLTARRLLTGVRASLLPAVGTLGIGAAGAHETAPPRRGDHRQRGDECHPAITNLPIQPPGSYGSRPVTSPAKSSFDSALAFIIRPSPKKVQANSKGPVLNGTVVYGVRTYILRHGTNGSSHDKRRQPRQTEAATTRAGIANSGRP